MYSIGYTVGKCTLNVAQKKKIKTSKRMVNRLVFILASYIWKTVINNTAKHIFIEFYGMLNTIVIENRFQL